MSPARAGEEDAGVGGWWEGAEGGGGGALERSKASKTGVRSQPLGAEADGREENGAAAIIKERRQGGRSSLSDPRLSKATRHFRYV